MGAEIMFIKRIHSLFKKQPAKKSLQNAQNDPKKRLF